jgi:hypothetical protein
VIPSIHWCCRRSKPCPSTTKACPSTRLRISEFWRSRAYLSSNLIPTYPNLMNLSLSTPTLLFIKAINAEVLTTFCETNTFELSYDNNLTYYLVKLQSNKLTQLFKHSVAVVIGNLCAITSPLVRLIELRVWYLSSSILRISSNDLTR